LKVDLTDVSVFDDLADLERETVPDKRFRTGNRSRTKQMRAYGLKHRMEVPEEERGL